MANSNFLPSIHDDFFANNNENAKKMIDFAVSHYQSMEHTYNFKKNYDLYSGIISPEERNVVTKIHGKQSRTPYAPYFLARGKMKLLRNEFLRMPMEANFYVSNKEAVAKKLEKNAEAIGRSFAKPYIKEMQSQGVPVYEGMDIPDFDQKSVFAMANAKIKEEIIIQKIINNIINEGLKTEMFASMGELILQSGCFGKNEKNAMGKESYRPIKLSNAIFMEADYDVFMKKTPFIGEKRLMFPSEVLREFDITPENNRELYDKIINSPTNESSSTIGNNTVHIVYTVQWKAMMKFYFRRYYLKEANRFITEYIQDEEIKNKDPFKYLKGYEDETVIQRESEVVLQGSKIFENEYLKIEQVPGTAIRETANGYAANFDYVGMLLDTVDGNRVSIAQLMYQLDRTYDMIRHKYNKEIKKLKGNVLFYNEAYEPTKSSFSDIMYDLEERGVMKFNSSEEGNKGNINASAAHPISGNNTIGNFDIVQMLIQAGLDVERSMDRVSGVSDTRQGLSKASATATANENDLDASRTQTYDLYYFMRLYINEVIMRMADKVKLAITDEKSPYSLLMSDEEYGFIFATKDIRTYTFDGYISDGRKEQEVNQKVEAMMVDEIRAGKLRTMDAINYWMKDTFSESIKTLEKAYTLLEQNASKSGQQEMEVMQQQQDKELQDRREEREDGQVNEKDNIKLKGMIERDNIRLKGQIEKQLKDIDRRIAGEKNLADANKKDDKSKPKKK